MSHSGTFTETVSATKEPVAIPKNDASIPALEALIHELRQFREGFAPRVDDLDYLDRLSSASPSDGDRPLLVQVQQQALQLAAAEYQLLTAKQDLKDLRAALDKAEAEKVRLKKQVAQNATAKCEIATMDVMQKEFTKLKNYLDYRLGDFLSQLTTRAMGHASTSVSAPAFSSAPLDVTQSVPPKAQAKGKRRQSLIHEWEVDATTVSQVPHRRDHSQDCDCSVTCLQWSEKGVTNEPLHCNPNSYSTNVSPISAAILKANHHGKDCYCIICMQWSGPPNQERCSSASGRPCSCCDCSLTPVLADRPDKEERLSHTAKSSIHSTHSTHSTCYEPSDSRFGQATHSRAASQAFGNDSYSLMLNYMLNSNVGSPSGSVKRVSTRSRANSRAAEGWTPPKAPSVCPPPSSVRWSSSPMYA